jgi:CBS-domain-containing membrane protein
VLCDHSEAQTQFIRQIMHSRAVVPDATPVCEMMTTHVFCVRPDVSLDALLGFLLERNISSVPVVDERGTPIGMVSKTDIVRHRYESDDDDTESACEPLERGFHACMLAEHTVADLMSPVPIAFSESTPVSQVAAAMAYERVHQVPIVAVDGTVVGIVSSLDIVRWYVQREGYVAGRRGDHS